MEESVTHSSGESSLSQPSFEQSHILPESVKNYESAYSASLQKAQDYARQLIDLAKKDDYLNEISNWLTDYLKTSHKSAPFNNRFQVSDADFDIASWSFLEKIHVSRQLKGYIFDSFSYMLMRDIGLDPNDEKTHDVCRAFAIPVFRNIRQNISAASTEDRQYGLDNVIPEYLKHDIDIKNELFQLKSRVARIQQLLPESLDKANGIRKLVKIIAGVILHEQINQKLNPVSPHEHRKRICSALKLGYSYGITYPLIDDILDNRNFLDEDERKLFNQSIQSTLLTQSVVSFPRFHSSNVSFMSFVYQELSFSFKTIKQELGGKRSQQFFQSAYVFFKAQAEEVKPKTQEANLTLDPVSAITPMIVKSAGSRIIANQLSNEPGYSDTNFFYFGIYNQFNDDIKDIEIDYQENNLTPYSAPCFGKILSIQAGRIHWAIVYYLVKHVYRDNAQVKAMMMQRTINAYQSIRAKINEPEFNRHFFRYLSTNNTAFDQKLLTGLASKNRVAWFDKFISAQLSKRLSKEEQDSQAFFFQYKQYKSFVDKQLKLHRDDRDKKNTLFGLQDYAVLNGGKRIRSVVAFHLMTQHWGNLPESAIPVIRMLEYMHVASMIIDDLPSQDNANYRRGKPALHKYSGSVAAAELTAVSLIMKAVEEQTLMQSFSAEKVLKTLQYATQTAQAITDGQLLDLQSSCDTTFDELCHLTWLKTGLGIEASFIIPAILNDAPNDQVNFLKSIAKHMGMAFQIRDDLLDCESSKMALGKPTQQDINKASFVTVLGQAEAWQHLRVHYEQARKLIQQLNRDDIFLRKLLDFIVFRHH